MKNKVKELFKKLGIRPNVKGYYYLIEAILLIAESEERLTMGDVYQKIAFKHNDTYSKVERAMRYAIQKNCCQNGEYYMIFNTFDRPRVSEFVFTIAEEIKGE